MITEIFKNSFKTDVALKHDFGQVRVSRNRKGTDREAPRERERERAKESVTSSKKVKKDSKLAVSTMFAF